MVNLRFPILSILISSLLFFNCNHAKQKTKSNEASNIPKNPLQQAIEYGDFFPMANGSAYLSSDKGIYYISSGIASKISTLPEGYLNEIIPLADGTALLKINSTENDSLYWLNGLKAIEVKIGDEITRNYNSELSSNFYFIQAQNTLRKLQEYQNREISDEEPPVDPDRW